MKMRQRIFAAALVAVATPPAAGADTCPTRAELDDGIRLTRTDPYFSSVFTQTPQGLTERRVISRDGVTRDISTFYKHPLLPSERIEDNLTIAQEYDQPTEALDTLDQSIIWSSSVTMQINGEPYDSGTETVTYLGEDFIYVGECKYTIWVFNVLTEWDSRAPTRFEKTFAPRLGLILSSIGFNPDGTTRGGVFFDQIAAE